MVKIDAWSDAAIESFIEDSARIVAIILETYALTPRATELGIQYFVALVIGDSLTAVHVLNQLWAEGFMGDDGVIHELRVAARTYLDYLSSVIPDQDSAVLDVQM